MRKLVINGRYLTQPVTGVQRYAHELVQAIDNLLLDHPRLVVELLSPRLSGNAPVFHNIIHRAVGHTQGHIWEQFELPRHIDDGVLFCPGNTAPLISLFTRSKVVVTVHDLSYLYFPKAYSLPFRIFYRVVIPTILRKAAAVITVSNSEKAAILAHYPYVIDRIHAVQNGGLPSGVTPPSSNPLDSEKECYVLYVGSLSKRKNFPGVFKVACQIARLRGTRFVFVGGVSGGIADSEYIVPEDLQDLIQFVGQVNDSNKLMGIYRSAACFLFPSFYEASPLPPIEAMACGCPVIASSIPSLKERCEDAAIYCDPNNVAEMCSTLERVLDDEDLRRNLKVRGYQQAAKYNWENCANATMKVLDECNPIF